MKSRTACTENTLAEMQPVSSTLIYCNVCASFCSPRRRQLHVIARSMNDTDGTALSSVLGMLLLILGYIVVF